MKRTLLAGLIVFGFFLAACGSSSSEQATQADDHGASSATVTKGLRFTTSADFSSSASVPSANLSKGINLTKTTTATCAELAASNGVSVTAIVLDDPILADGLDCEGGIGDGGRVAHLTPQIYTLALKRATLIATVGSNIDLIPEKATLALSQIVTFNEGDTLENITTIDPADLSAGTYSGVELEIYYFQMKFSVANVDTNVRFYMSDDDFPAEGSLGHHQGDVTFVDASGNELGWIDSTWLTANLSSSRAGQVGAATPDTQTGHARGFFGNDDLWNAAEQMQGANQDVYTNTVAFASALEIPAPDAITDLTTVTVAFSIADTFFYEDFSPYGSGADANANFPGFYPATGGEAAGGEWAPLTPVAAVEVTGASNNGGKSWTDSGSALTIDSIVNGAGFPSISRSGKVVPSADAQFYFGRFLYYNGTDLFSGAVKFKLNKYDATHAYFSDFALEHYSQVTDYNAATNVVTASTDLEVSSAYNATSNHLEITDATVRFVGFDIDFGNNDYFGDVVDAGVMFSEDFTTMAGGNNESFFFIAQKVDSQPDVSESAITGNWNTRNFTVDENGEMTIDGSSTVTVDGAGGNGFTAFTGVTNESDNFDGELAMTDATSGSFFFGFGAGDGTVTATRVDGAFLVSADQSLAVGINARDGHYFAAER